MKKEIDAFLDNLNRKYEKLHRQYESLFWVSYMYDSSVDSKKDEALKKRDAFRSDGKLLKKVTEFLPKANTIQKSRLLQWKRFFESYQTPKELLDLKNKINILESKIQSTRSTRKQGYVDPKTKEFVVSPINEIKTLISISDDKNLRKACFDALQTSAEPMLDDFVELIKMRNEYANKLGYKDFYEYKLLVEEGMTKKELFSLFDTIYAKTKYAFKTIRGIEKKRPGIREPWNFGYMFAGSFIKEEDPYYLPENMLTNWGTSFAALGIDFKKGSLTLDLLERNGKYNNGFCHWPTLVHFQGKKRVPGVSNFTCNIIPGKMGEISGGMNTLFHEGGHAAHLLNSNMQDVCSNHEYAPMSTAWAETQSMFLDTMFSSIEWRTRYLKNKEGEPYPFNLFERKVKELAPLSPLAMMSIMMVMYFEKNLYEDKALTKDKVVNYAKDNYIKYTDRSTTSTTLLEIPHIYAWESACSYHGYGLAELALSQWRKYFYKKYGYIVDNKNVGKEMEKVWKLGGSKTFPEFVKLATGKKLSPDAFIESITASPEKVIKKSKEKIKKLESIKRYSKAIDLNASIKLVHGKEVIADNKKGFEKMAKRYLDWFEKQIK